jgi:ribosomal protein S18 acetylase RimI-like enzyme
MIRNAGKRDLGRLIEIEERCFDPRLYSRMSRRQFQLHISSSNAVLRIFDRGGHASGYALGLLHRGWSFLRFYSLAVDPGEQGGEIGRLLFSDMEEQSGLRGLGILCEVRKDNLKLKERYIKLGYEAYREVADYYPDGAACVKFRKRDVRPT